MCELKEGDEVFCKRKRFGWIREEDRLELLKIIKTTKTLVITSDGDRWRKPQSGSKNSCLEKYFATGNDNYSYITKLTPALFLEVEDSLERVAIRDAWYEISNMKQPKHLSSNRLKEILKELKNETKQKNDV